MELGDGMCVVRIPPQDDGWLGFDLAEVMSAVGDRADLRWVLRFASFNGDVLTCTQIVDGEFSGYREERLRMRLEVVDSSYWVVAADDPRALASVRSAFHGVTDDSQLV
ncbi:hypothetical protein AB5J62_22290 [Amycolatopsis sp. cg5]|uniref:hypothetical protein n=1 Tax=Amycolatopsis sp. cg5 TaxID=3238802 RepID=UPI003523398C